MVIYSSRSGAVEVGVISHIYSRLFDKGLHIGLCVRAQVFFLGIYTLELHADMDVRTQG